jgi:hypothetical protein
MDKLTQLISGLEGEIKLGKTQPKPNPTTLSVRRIKTKEDIFQHRNVKGWISEPHIEKLTKILDGCPLAQLDPITVFWTGNAWCCIDGHHRLAAYRKTSMPREVPVQVFEGTLQEAIIRSLESNSKDKLPMTSQEKSDSAWRLTVCFPNMPKRALSAASGVSERTIAYMRETREALKQGNFKGELSELSWQAARLATKGISMDGDTLDDHIQRRAQALADRLTRHFGGHLNQDPSILARALSICNESLPRRLTDAWAQDGELETEEELEDA